MEEKEITTEKIKKKFWELQTDERLIQFLKNNIVTLGLIYVFLSAVAETFGLSHSGEILEAIANAIGGITPTP